MQEIKYRAWIVSDEYPKGIMVFPEEGKSELLEKCSQCKYGILLNLNGDILTSWHKPKVSSTTYGVVFGRIGHNEQILMQFTGLKDINNKEIYHRDIVKFKPCNDISLRKEFREQEVIAQIIWDNELAKFDVDWSGHAEYHSEFPYFKMEVIGNKFKNPELLK